LQPRHCWTASRKTGRVRMFGTNGAAVVCSALGIGPSICFDALPKRMENQGHHRSAVVAYLDTLIANFLKRRQVHIPRHRSRSFVQI
jgi:hypothetical protein